MAAVKLVINTDCSAFNQEVFDKHGAVTGTRPPKIVANDVLSGGNRLIFMVSGNFLILDSPRLTVLRHTSRTVKSGDESEPSYTSVSR